MMPKLVNDKTEEDMRAKLVQYEVAAHLHEGLLAYLFGGYLPGNFLCCVLENDLAGAVLRADHVSLATLKNLVSFLNMEVPQTAHGSGSRVQAYAEERQAIQKRCVNSSTEPD